MFLIDTNIWLERLLGQERSEDVGIFLEETLAKDIRLTDFTFHSIAVILAKQGLLSVLERFTTDVLVEVGVVLVRLAPEDTRRVISSMQQFRLDFDDAYQYVAAEIHDLGIVSFDKHFDETPRGRIRLEDLHRPEHSTGSHPSS